MADRTKQPWERQPKETIRAYAAFCVYRNMGAERSLTNAVRFYLSEKARKTATKQQRQQRRWRAHPTPGKYLRNVRRRWGHWSHKHSWVDRCVAYDEHQEYELRHAELEAEGKAREEKAKERIQQRELLGKEAISLRTIARLLAARILEVLGDKEALKTLKLTRVKTVDGDKFNRTEEITPGILDLIKLAGDGMDVGSRLYRLAQLDEPDEAGQGKTAEKRAQEVAGVLTEQLLKLDLGALLELREGLIGLNGGPEKE